MARYQHLPVYNLIYLLTREVHRVHAKLPKTIKFTLGSGFFESSLKCLKGVIVANGSQSKLLALQEVSLEIEVMWTFLRLLYDFKGITKGEFQVLSERLAEIGPQIEAWMKWEKTQSRSTEKFNSPIA
jgi:hypothetical protein